MARPRIGVITRAVHGSSRPTDSESPPVLELRRASPHNMSARRVPLTKQMPILKPDAKLYELKLRNGQ